MGSDGAAIPGIGLPTDRLKLARTDLAGLTLKPEEMFVVSRLAGVELSVSELLGSTGLPRAQAIDVVSRLIHAGIFQNLNAEKPPQAAKAAPPSAPRPPVPAARPVPTPPAAAKPVPAVARAPIDPEAADLPADLQHEIVEIEPRVRSQNPREVLGIPASATVDDVKTAYFALAQRYHPDQFFRKKLGSFKPRVDQVFARVTWAFQELSRNPNAGNAPEPVAPSPEPTAAVADDDFPPFEPSELPEMADEEASEITGRPRDRYRKAVLRHRWDIARDALSSLAADEPNALDLPKLRADLSRQSEAEAADLFEKGNELGGKSEWPAAFKCYQEAAALDPRNARYVERAGRAMLYDGDLKEAKRLVERALELNPSDADAHVTLGNVFLKAGMEKNAKRSFEAALKFDPKNEYAKSHVRKGWWKG